MSHQIESQGMRDSTVAESTASGSWDPYQVWLTRVKQPREERRPVEETVATTAAVPATTTTVKVATTDLSETARLRTLTLPAG